MSDTNMYLLIGAAALVLVVTIGEVIYARLERDRDGKYD